MVRNVHERVVAAPASELGPLLDRLGGPDDAVWPSPQWPAMILDRPLSIGADGGHGPVRYHVIAHDRGRSAEFVFDPALARGTHTLSITPLEPGRTLVRHVIDARLTGMMRLLWPVAVRWLHDAVIEDAFDRMESAVGTGPRTPARWSPWVRLLQRLGADRAVAVAVPVTRLLATALPRVDFADAYAVDCRPRMPTDPQVWADAVFRDPPRWFVAALGLREALVGFVGIDRADPSSFDTVASTDDEVLLGTDERHLDFRASILREPDRVVLTTVVQLHNARGRAYFALVRLVHPVIVRAMLTRASHRLSRSPEGEHSYASGYEPG